MRKYEGHRVHVVSHKYDIIISLTVQIITANENIINNKCCNYLDQSQEVF